MAPPPKYSIVILGGFPLLLMACFLCFMGRNVLTRDEFFRIHDVVLTRPISNFRLLASKLAALVIAGWIPIAIFMLFIQGGAFLQNYVNIDFSESFETTALLKFLFFTCPVTLGLVAVLSLLFNLLFRNNLLTLVVLLALVIFCGVLITKISMSQYIFFEGLPLVGSFGSGLVPESIEFSDIVRYVGYLAVVLFLFFTGVVLYGRRDVFVRGNVLAGLVGGVVFVLCISSTTSSAIAHDSKLKLWSNGLQQKTVLMSPQVDFVNLHASVELEPTSKLSIQTDLDVHVLSTVLEDVLLWLNPGFAVREVKIDGNPVFFELDQQGALRIEVSEPLESNQDIRLTLIYDGVPDLDYGYLDSSTDVSKMPMWDQLLSYMGDTNGIYDSNYVALPQELNWLPAPFLPLFEKRVAKDFFNTHISLTLPSAWEATLPGRKLVNGEGTSQEKEKTLEFVSEVPVSTVNLFAGPLKSFSREINGINFEVLLSEPQLARQSLLHESLEEITEAFAERLDANKLDGFELPCSDFRFIAVPQRLRVYGGGTFLPSLLSDKCSYLLREFDFFAVDWSRAIPDYLRSQLERYGMTRGTYLLQVLKNYFRFSVQGANFELDLFNTYWDHEVGIVGPEAEVLSLILAYLNDLVWYASMDGFSASGYFPTAMGSERRTPNSANVMFGGQIHLGMARHHLNQVVKPLLRHIDLVETTVTHDLYSEALQETALSHSIQQTLASELDPFLVETLRLRSAHLSFQLFQILEEEGAKLLFDELLARYKYSNFRLEDLYATSTDLGLPVEEVLHNWFVGKEQPKYALSTAQTYRRESTDDLEDEFQTFFHVLNQGEGIGVFRTALTTETPGLSAWSAQAGADFAISSPGMIYGSSSAGPTVLLKPGQAVEVGIVSDQKPLRVLVQPLNVTVGGGRLGIPTKLVEDTRTIDTSRIDEFHGYRPSTWSAPHVETGIVVDDLDPSFLVEDDKQVSDVRTWRRVDYPSAWGNSRRTMVYCESKNPKSIKFQTDLPNGGLWGLEFHLPDLRGKFGDYQQGFLPRGRIGSGGGSWFFWQSIAGDYKFTLDAGDFSEEVDVSISESDFGWIRVTEALLEPGNTVVSVRPRNTDGKLFGDAIRWVQVDAGE